jgi:single-strand DNA-binding protein
MTGEPLVTLVGQLGADPELKFLPSGVPVCNFSLASTPRVKDGDSWTDGETMWVRCAVWRELAENVAESSLVKGTRVIVQGRLKVRSFETDAGEKRTSIEMDVDAIGPELRFATAKVTKAQRSDSGGQQASRPAARPQRSSAPSSDPWGDVPPPEEEPPF